jgi:RIO kinase 1
LREHDSGRSAQARGRRRFDDDEPTYLKRSRHRPDEAALAEVAALDLPPVGDRWTTWDVSGVVHGPQPRPDWVITELAAVDTELGVLKTGKEAEVHLLERSIPDTDRSVLLAAKRYRAPEHRLFHRDAGYLEGRRVRESRMSRAMVSRTSFGMELIAGQWAAAEFDALARLWEIGRTYGGIRVPYPVSLSGTELLLEFIGTAGAAAPRLVQLRPDRAQLASLWAQLVDAVTVLARAGLAHGDLSPYNVLVRDGQLVLIDLPQVVDVVINPAGPEFLRRDVTVMATWFTARGYPVDPADLVRNLLADVGLR